MGAEEGLDGAKEALWVLREGCLAMPGRGEGTTSGRTLAGLRSDVSEVSVRSLGGSRREVSAEATAPIPHGFLSSRLRGRKPSDRPGGKYFALNIEAGQE